ncbi:MAG TPA: YkgJ family cysteine cluster protein [Candidatus Nanoarchaeia archaeon]|nr:YkgJ family cysteine cluster protein [Candidatus Nanoarchaeia archaeon]
MIKITKQTPLKEILKLAPACKCVECSNGCKFGSGMLAKGDEKKLAEYLKISEDELKENFLEETERFHTKMLRPKILRGKNSPFGRCTFYDEKEGCKVHEAKPLECKTSMGCRDYGEELSIWFMLNNTVNENDAESVRQYSQYIKSGGKVIEGAKLEEIVPDKEKLSKILSYEIL